jgi:hypothetical protein
MVGAVSFCLSKSAGPAAHLCMPIKQNLEPNWNVSGSHGPTD